MIARAALVPEIALHLATRITPIWQATEDFLRAQAMEPPFWAFAWPGSQVLARRMLDEPSQVAGRHVLDFAAGCGLAAIAAAMAGARADAAEIDPMADAAITLNAQLNGAAVACVGDVVGTDAGWDVIMAGDVCYEAPMTSRIMPWLRRLAARGATVWLADPGRAYLPRDGLLPVLVRAVPTTRELEDSAERVVTLYRLTA